MPVTRATAIATPVSSSPSNNWPIASTTALPKGKVQIKVDVAYKGKAGEFGKGATVTMTVNGTKVAEGELPNTIPQQISMGEGTSP
jgi:hypothetical protein